MRKFFLFATFAVVFSLLGFRANAQVNIHETENRIHSVFIYNFTKYVQWPEDYNSGDFNIAILGETNLDQELQKMAAAKTINGRKIIVKKYTNVKNIDAKCHILFLTSGSSNLLSDVLRKMNGTPTLIITNKDGLGKFGSLINFISINGKHRFEINLNAFEKSKLKFEQQIKAVGILI